ncbi:MAG: DUF167 domain-containing protein [Thermodesulfobacteriota bacterium]
MEKRSIPFLSSGREGVYVRILVQPRASRTELVGTRGDRLKIRLAAPPVDGEANKTLIEFLSKLLKVKKSNVEIKDGEKSRRKGVLVCGVSLKEAAGVLGG